MIEKETAMFAAGCFWHPEYIFSNTPGVIKTEVGYSGGKTKNPIYGEVCGGKTGHAETVKIIFDKRNISYEKILDIFWEIHDPRTLNRQGADIGSQYRSVIFYNSLKQKEIAIKSKKERQKKIKGDIVTEIKKAGRFWTAEKYHQKYLKRKNAN